MKVRKMRNRRGAALIMSIITLGLLVSIAIGTSYVAVQDYIKADNHRKIFAARVNAETDSESLERRYNMKESKRKKV